MRLAKTSHVATNSCNVARLSRPPEPFHLMLTRLREEAGLQKKQLADELGVDYRLIISWEKAPGERRQAFPDAKNEKKLVAWRPVLYVALKEAREQRQVAMSEMRRRLEQVEAAVARLEAAGKDDPPASEPDALAQ